jgi:shikimate dehydrogenase
MTFYRLGLIGWPVANSLSPLIHRRALQNCGLSGEYKLYAVDPERFDEQAGGILEMLRRGELNGINVTIPYKQRVLAYTDRLTKDAQAAGAVNTLYLQDGSLVGDNTDIPGFWMDIERLGWGNNKGEHAYRHRSALENRAIVLGAGGAARAVALALGRQGWQVGLAARQEAQAVQAAAELNQAMGLGTVTGMLLNEDLLKVFGKPVALIINATSAGMHPQIETDPWPAQLPVPAQTRVYDLVYNPPVTRLLQRAQAGGSQTANGLGMLVGQAVLAFQHWTGQLPSFNSILHELLLQIDAKGISILEHPEH